MRGVTRALRLPIEPAAAFALLHSPSAIRQWWSATSVIRRYVIMGRP